MQTEQLVRCNELIFSYLSLSFDLPPPSLPPSFSLSPLWSASLSLSLSLTQVIYWLSGCSLLQGLLGRRQGAQWSGNDKCARVDVCVCEEFRKLSVQKSVKHLPLQRECVCVCVMIIFTQI